MVLWIFFQMRPSTGVFFLLCLQLDLILETKVGFDAGGLEIWVQTQHCRERKRRGRGKNRYSDERGGS